MTTENLDFQYDGLPIGVEGVPETPAAWYYNNDQATYGVNGNKYGLLYNGYAAYYMYSHATELFPDGWNLLGDNGFYNFLMNTGIGYNGGTALKSTTGWNDNGNGDNSSGFNAKPAGYRGTNGIFYSVGYTAYIAQGQNQSYQYNDTNLHLDSSNNTSSPYSDAPRNGASVRLFKIIS